MGAYKEKNYLFLTFKYRAQPIQQAFAICLVPNIATQEGSAAILVKISWGADGRRDQWEDRKKQEQLGTAAANCSEGTEYRS